MGSDFGFKKIYKIDFSKALTYTSVTSLMLGGNKVSSFKSSIKLDRLKKLLISNFKTFKLDFNHVPLLSSLRLSDLRSEYQFLNLRENVVDELFIAAISLFCFNFKDFPTLKKLEILNQKGNLDKLHLSHCTSLEHLLLDCKKLEPSYLFLEKLNNLRALSLEKINFENIAPHLRNLGELRFLSLRYVENIENLDFLEYMPKLEFIELTLEPKSEMLDLMKVQKKASIKKFYFAVKYTISKAIMNNKALDKRLNYPANYHYDKDGSYIMIRVEDNKRERL